VECLEFRRAKLSRPREHSPELERHAAGCAACAEFAKEADAFEERLAQAVSVPVPEGIADRVLLNYKLQRGRRYGRYAIAAAMLLGIGLLMTYSQIARRDVLTSAVIAHVVSMPEALQNVQNVPEGNLAQALATHGGGCGDR
jgi:anti-sigma factor RsiW